MLPFVCKDTYRFQIRIKRRIHIKNEILTTNHPTTLKVGHGLHRPGVTGHRTPAAHAWFLLLVLWLLTLVTFNPILLYCKKCRYGRAPKTRVSRRRRRRGGGVWEGVSPSPPGRGKLSFMLDFQMSFSSKCLLDFQMSGEEAVPPPQKNF